MRMIILAAGQGTRLRPLTDTIPKCLVEFNGRALIDWQLEAAHAAGIKRVIVVGGYLAEQIRRPELRLVVNSDYEDTNMVYSLFCAEEEFGEGFVMSYGDIAYDPVVLRTLLAAPSPVAVIVDRAWRQYWSMRFEDPLTDAESLRIGPRMRIESIGQRETDIDSIEAQYIGLVAFRGTGVEALRRTHADAIAIEREGQVPFGGTRPLSKMFMTDMLQGMIDSGYTITAVPIERGWVEIDSVRDLKLAEKLMVNGQLEAVIEQSP